MIYPDVAELVTPLDPDVVERCGTEVVAVVFAGSIFPIPLGAWRFV